jgi:hypothetical protein
MDSLNRRTVSGQVQTEWGLVNPDAVSSDLVSTMTAGSALETEIKIGSGYYLLRGGAVFETGNADMAGVWSIEGAGFVHPAALARKPRFGLTRFVQSTDTNDKRIFIVDRTGLYLMAAPHNVFNLGYVGEPRVGLPPSELTSRGVHTWDNVMGQDGAGTKYVFDTSAKRRFADTSTQNQWTNSGSYSMQSFSNNFLNLLPNHGVTITKSIRSGDLAVFAVVNGQKRHIQSAQTYQTQYAPVVEVGGSVKDSLPTGTPVP